MKINNIMPKVSAIIATTNMEEPKNLGIVIMRNSMQQGCVKIVTLITIIVKNVKPRTVTTRYPKKNNKI
jgi:hypothetical protein